MFARLMTPAALAVLLIFSLVWLVAMWRWREAAQMPAARELAIYLLALPLGIVAAYALLRRLMQRVLTPPAAPERSVVSASTPSSPSEASSTPANVAHRPAIVLRSGLRLAHGTSGAEVVAAVRAGARPAPDPRLRDASGFPVFALAVPDVDTAAARNGLQALTVHAGHIDALPEDRLRALALLDDLSAAMLAEGMALLPLTNLGASPRSPAARLHVVVGVPQRWSDAARSLAARSLAGQLAIVPEAHRGAVVALVADEDGPDLIAHGMHHLQAHGERDLCLVLAADSSVTQPEVDARDRAGDLFSNARQRGRIPGEGAAALLLADARLPFQPDGEAACLWPAAHESHPSAVSEERRGSPDVMKAVGDAALVHASSNLVNVRAVVSDADHRPVAMVEIGQWLQDKLPHLAFERDCILVGAACGHLGAAAPLVALALGHHLAGEQRQPVAVASVAHAQRRSAQIFTPCAGESATPSST